MKTFCLICIGISLSSISRTEGESSIMWQSKKRKKEDLVSIETGPFKLPLEPLGPHYGPGLYRGSCSVEHWASLYSLCPSREPLTSSTMSRALLYSREGLFSLKGGLGLGEGSLWKSTFPSPIEASAICCLPHRPVQPLLPFSSFFIANRLQTRTNRPWIPRCLAAAARSSSVNPLVF